MLAKRLNPILNVSNIVESFAWFEKLGWQKGFVWGDPPTFGAVSSGEFEIFLCQGAQGGRGKSNLETTRDSGGEDGDKGVWMSVWVDDVDAVHRHCLEQGLEVTLPPTNEPWGVREMHVRHPDGHVFRISSRSGWIQSRPESRATP
jgi:catechol 2,3-dioxygenase-like lactoylglutathione lyase family enzyme